MDIRCVKCGEPWDIDALHDVAEEEGRTFTAVRSAFMRRGCEVLWGAACNTATVNTGASATIAAVYDLLGDDIDGAAAMLEDADMMGLL